jgi:putative membrane protein
MKRTTVVTFIVGLAVITILVVSRGAGAIWDALASIGWGGFAAICATQLVLIALMGLSWRIIVAAPNLLPVGTFFWARLIRDSGAEILPLSQLGGFVMGARAATLVGLPSTLSAASTVVDVTLELFAQLAFTAIGLGLLLLSHPDSRLAWPIAGGLAVMSTAATAFVVAQRRGLSIVDRIASHMLGDWVRTGLRISDIQAAISAIYQQPGRLWLSTGGHLTSWIGSALQAWFALRLMGVSIDLGDVLAIESLLYAIRSVAFAVPNAVGVQEGAYLVLGGLFGLGPDTVLALSLLKRARDLTLGLPALLAWQAIEARRALRVPDEGHREEPVAPALAGARLTETR